MNLQSMYPVTVDEETTVAWFRREDAAVSYGAALALSTPGVSVQVFDRQAPESSKRGILAEFFPRDDVA